MEVIAKKAVVLLSGGVDSSTCLAMAVKSVGKENVTALNMFYGQRNDREVESAQNVAKYYGVRYLEMDMSKPFELGDCPLLKHSARKVAHKSYGEQVLEKEDGIVDTYVPFRNGVFLSTAVAIALSIGADVVMYGAHADDSAGGAYPDCSEAFASAMNAAIVEGTGGRVRLVAPFLNIDKAGVVKKGLELGVPYELTWSCYEGKDKPCGECGTCINRAEAFAANGVKDPALKEENTL